jgi:hypothetical protein
MRVADKLNKFPHEVEALSCDEFDRIVAFYIFEDSEQKKSKKNHSTKNTLNPNDYLRGRHE